MTSYHQSAGTFSSPQHFPATWANTVTSKTCRSPSLAWPKAERMRTVGTVLRRTQRLECVWSLGFCSRCQKELYCHMSTGCHCSLSFDPLSAPFPLAPNLLQDHLVPRFRPRHPPCCPSPHCLRPTPFSSHFRSKPKSSLLWISSFLASFLPASWLTLSTLSFLSLRQ